MTISELPNTWSFCTSYIS